MTGKAAPVPLAIGVFYKKTGSITRILMKNYAQMLFVDTDILIASNASNIFETGLSNQFDAAEVEYSMVVSHKRLTQDKPGKISWCDPYINSVMLLLSLVHREVSSPNSALLRKWLSVQAIFTTSCQTHLNYTTCVINLNAKANFHAVKKFSKNEVYRYL